MGSTEVGPPWPRSWMYGYQDRQTSVLCAFNPEKLVPAERPLRGIKKLCDRASSDMSACCIRRVPSLSYRPADEAALRLSGEPEGAAADRKALRLPAPALRGPMRCAAAIAPATQ